jgi:hypothetical protein
MLLIDYFTYIAGLLWLWFGICLESLLNVILKRITILRSKLKLHNRFDFNDFDINQIIFLVFYLFTRKIYILFVYFIYLIYLFDTVYNGEKRSPI